MTQKQKVKDVAVALCKANNTVSTLEVKNELRKSFPKEPWYQNDVSQYMDELNNDGEFNYTDNGTFRVYSLTTTPKVAAKKVTSKVSTQNISRTKAIEIMEGTNGKFFKVKFIKKDGNEREMVCQYNKAVKKSPLGYINLTDVAAVRKGEKSTIKSVNLQTLSEVKTNGKVYKVS